MPYLSSQNSWVRKLYKFLDTMGQIEPSGLLMHVLNFYFLYRKDQRITMYGKGKSKGQFHPIRDFNKLGFEENLLGAVKNFKEPTPIQASAWPIIASGRDTIGKSNF